MPVFWKLMTWGAAVALALLSGCEAERASESLRRPQARVVYRDNDTAVPMRAVPFAAQVTLKTEVVPAMYHVCSGTIVATRFVLTGGICVPHNVSEGVVLAGDVNYFRNKTFEKSNIQIRTVIKYNFSEPPEVLAMLMLNRHFWINSYVKIAQLTTDTSVPDTWNVTATAVGFANANGSYGVMSQVTFLTVPGSKCSQHLGASVLCSRGQPLTTVCDEDRGGPLFVGGNGSQPMVVVGFNRDRKLRSPSEGRYCGAPVAFCTFWFAGAFASWIDHVVNQQPTHLQDMSPPLDDSLEYDASPPELPRGQELREQLHEHLRPLSGASAALQLWTPSHLFRRLIKLLSP